MTRRNRAASVILLLLLAPAWAAAQPARRDAARPDPTPQQLQDAERARAAEAAASRDAAQRAERAAAEADRLAAERVAAATRLRQAEDLTAAAAERLETLAARRRDAERRLADRADSMQPMLPVIQRLSLFPAETLLAVPAEPEDRLRGLIVLRSLSRQLEVEAEALRRDQSDLLAALRAIEAEAPKFAALLAEQARQAAELDRRIADAQAMRREAEAESEAAAKRAAGEASRAESIKAALAALEARRKAEEARAREEALRAERRKRAEEAEEARRRAAALAPTTGAGTMQPHASPKGQLVPPVTGRVVRAWGESTDAGPASGVSYQAPPTARVIAPCKGRVVFADRFRSYGLLAIVDCGGGYHMVLSGFERLDTRAGQAVQAGEPIGVMPDWNPADGGRRPSLYVELRQDGQPVNPVPWLRAGGG
jgi:septal ring factor EnvC (AmiA/AmiB activator)